MKHWIVKRIAWIVTAALLLSMVTAALADEADEDIVFFDDAASLTDAEAFDADEVFELGFSDPEEPEEPEPEEPLPSPAIAGADAFDEEAALGNLKLRVRADAGVFQAGARLSASAAEDAALAEAAEALLPPGARASHCIFDISMRDMSGNESLPDAAFGTATAALEGLDPAGFAEADPDAALTAQAVLRDPVSGAAYPVRTWTEDAAVVFELPDCARCDVMLVLLSGAPSADALPEEGIGPAPEAMPSEAAGQAETEIAESPAQDAEPAEPSTGETTEAEMLPEADAEPAEAATGQGETGTGESPAQDAEPAEPSAGETTEAKMLPEADAEAADGQGEAEIGESPAQDADPAEPSAEELIGAEVLPEADAEPSEDAAGQGETEIAESPAQDADPAEPSTGEMIDAAAPGAETLEGSAADPSAEPDPASPPAAEAEAGAELDVDILAEEAEPSVAESDISIEEIQWWPEEGAASPDGEGQANGADEGADGTIVFETIYDAYSETVAMPGTDNDALFDAFFQREMSLRTRRGMLRAGAFKAGRASLSELPGSLTIYDYLADRIPAIARGEITSAAFQPTDDQMGISDHWWTKEDLGLDNLEDDERIAALKQKEGFDVESLLNAINVDYPYDLYWYDKPAGMVYSFNI